MKIPFGISYQLDPSEYRDGIAASVKDCYRVQTGSEEHWRKRKGLTLLSADLDGAFHGGFVANDGRVLCAFGTKLYSVISDGTATELSGPMLNADVPCIFAEDFQNVYFVNGGKIMRIGGAFYSELGGNSPDGVTFITFSKGFLLCNGKSGGGVDGDTNFSDDVTNNYEGSASWEVFNNERLPDGCTAIVSGWDAEVYSFGPRSVEVSYNDGTTPWAVLSGAYMQYGLLAPYSLTIADNTLFWLTEADGARRVVKMENRVPKIISGPFDHLLNEFETVSDAIAWVQLDREFSFYVITFPSAGRTFAYKFDDSTWCELTYYNTATATHDEYRGRHGFYVRAWNKTLLGDRDQGTLYYIGGTSDNNNPIRLELTSGIIELGTLKQKAEKMLYHRAKSGCGGSFGLRIRDDNKAWKNEKTITLPTLNTKPYIKQPSGGAFRGRQYQIIHTADTEFVYMGLENDINGTGR